MTIQLPWRSPDPTTQALALAGEGFAVAPAWGVRRRFHPNAAVAPLICECGGGGLQSCCVGLPAAHPRHRGWNHVATCDHAVIAEWSERFPGGGYIVATGRPGGLIALDVEDDDGLRALRRAEHKIGPLPRTAVSRAPGGRVTVWMRQPLHRPVPLSGRLSPASAFTASTPG